MSRQVASSAFLMIHNCWTFLAGNRHYLRDVADDMEEFDALCDRLFRDNTNVARFYTMMVIRTAKEDMAIRL